MLIIEGFCRDCVFEMRAKLSKCFFCFSFLERVFISSSSQTKVLSVSTYSNQVEVPDKTLPSI